MEQESPERMLSEILALAREYKLSSYDASYLDLAMRKGLPIATTDKIYYSSGKKKQCVNIKRKMNIKRIELL